MCTADPAALPGLEHLRPHVDDWAKAVRTLSLTAGAIAESVAGGMARKAAAGAEAADRQHVDQASFAQSLPSLPPPPPTVALPAVALKPGRLFIVANLSGAYYTLLDLLSAHKFDFRTDNLMHVGNLVAPPAALLPPPPPSTSYGVGADGVGAVPRDGGAAGACRNSTSVLKLVRRHSARGPMGSHECLTLLAAAAANRQRAAEAEAAAAAAAERRRALAGTSALTMQLAAATAAAGSAGGAAMAAPSAATAVPAGTERWPARRNAMQPSDASSSESDSDSSSDSDSEAGDAGMNAAACGAPSKPSSSTPAAELVSAPPTPCRGEEGQRCSTQHTSTPAAQYQPHQQPHHPPHASRPALDNLDLVHLLGMPARVVLEPYGIALQHAGPPPPPLAPSSAAAQSQGRERYHIIYSHRRSGAAGAAAAGPSTAAAAAAATSTSTGLSCPRPVLRAAVLPPLRSLHRSSPGFVAKMEAGLPPSRGELLLEFLEQPLSDLDTR